MNIFVSNLSFRMDQDSLKELFENFGEVTSCKIMTDKFTGKSRGFGFVEMPNDGDAQKAIDGLNEKDVDGRNISVSVAKPRTEGGGGGGKKFGGGGGRRERW
jgi:RNA recognition motif-containing protein